MTAQGGAISWESTLLSWAYEALDARALTTDDKRGSGVGGRGPVSLSRQPAITSGQSRPAGVPPSPRAIGHPPSSLERAAPEGLRAAYRHCERVTKTHSRTFYVASGLLPYVKRRAVRALYAFCRVSDDLVDRAVGDPRAALEAWRARLDGAGQHRDPVARAWADTRLRHGIPDLYSRQLLDGVARDLEVTRYTTFEELAAYCYGVASTVGLMAMHIVGFSGTEAIPYAVKLGVALQLTNILRDVGEDWRAGRLYLPAEELAAFGLDEADVAAGRVDERWRRFMRFQVDRNRRLYAEARPGIAMLSRDARFAIAAAADLYQAILQDIERHDMDVFNRRAHLSGWAKARRLPALWRKTIGS
jgi:15-cis-phytoene synthase